MAFLQSFTYMKINWTYLQGNRLQYIQGQANERFLLKKREVSRKMSGDLAGKRL